MIPCQVMLEGVSEGCCCRRPRIVRCRPNWWTGGCERLDAANGAQNIEKGIVYIFTSSQPALYILGLSLALQQQSRNAVVYRCN